MTKTVAKSAAKGASKHRPSRTGRPPGQLSDDTRRRIVAAARDCFVRLGFERATNKHIASVAGITAAALYRYFDSKSELYAAVVRECSAGHVVRLQETIKSALTVRDAFGAILRAMGEATQSADVQFLAGVPTEMQRHPEIATRMIADPGEIDAVFRKLVQSGVRTGEIAREKAARTVALMFASFMGISSYSGTLGRDQGEQAIAGLLDLLAGQLFSAVPTRPTDAAARLR